MATSTITRPATTGGAQRAQMVLDHYDRDPEGSRLFRLLADLAEWCDDQGFIPLEPGLDRHDRRAVAPDVHSPGRVPGDPLMGRPALTPLCRFDWDHFMADVTAWRDRRRITSRQLGLEVGLTGGTMHSWLNGSRRTVSADTLAGLAFLCDLDLNTYIIDPTETT